MDPGSNHGRVSDSQKLSDDGWRAARWHVRWGEGQHRKILQCRFDLSLLT